MITHSQATPETTSWVSLISKIQDVDAKALNAHDPDLMKDTIKLFEKCADSLSPSDLFVDKQIAELAAEAARLKIGDTNTTKIIAAIAERKAGGGKVAIKKVFDSAKSKQAARSGENMAAEWEQKLLYMVEEMNINHANVISGGKNLIVRFRDGEIDYIPPRELDGVYKHDKYTTGVRRDGERIEKTRIEAWVGHKDHRRYEDGVEFRPLPIGVEDTNTRTLNTWTGFQASPAPGDWSLIDYHIREVLAAGNKQVYEYLLNWCAYTIQHPARQAGAVPVFRGIKRTGKGIFANWLVSLWGNHGVMVNNGKHLVGQFNGHLEHTCLLFLDEAIYAGDKKHESMLKSLITEPKLMVERKHHDARPADNRLKIIMATNESWAVPTSTDDARFCVCDVSDKHKGDTGYFDKLKAQMETLEAKQGFMQAMVDRDISSFRTGNIPVTNGLRDQIRETLPPIWHWWQDVLEAGQYGSGDDAQEIGETASAKDLYMDYVRWSDQMRKGEYARMSLTAWGREFSGVYGKRRTMAGMFYVLGGAEDALMSFERVKIGIDDCPAEEDGEDCFTL